MRCQRILELRRHADPLVEILKEKAARGENVGAGGTMGEWRFATFPNEVQNKHLYQEVPAGHHVE